MPITEARIATDRPGRYLTQFCKHAAAMGSSRGHRVRLHGRPEATDDDVQLRVEHTGTDGTVDFDPWGRCLLHADSDALVVRVEATDDEALQRIQNAVGRDLERFSRGNLAVNWQAVDGADAGQPPEPQPAAPGHIRSLLRRRHLPMLIAAAAALAVAAHLGVFAFALTHWHWTLSTVGAIALILLAKALVIVGYRHARIKPRRHQPPRR